MTAFNFQARFAAAVESGKKFQTIRALRKDGRQPQVGDKLQLYTGMRTKQCRKLRDATCTWVHDIRINVTSVEIDAHVVDGDVMARQDGFGSFADMRAWFEKTHGLPFVGKLYRWDTADDN